VLYIANAELVLLRTSIVFAPWLFTLAANVSMLAEPHCMGTYSIWESIIYWAGLLPQSYCQVIKLLVWFALFRSPGVSPEAKASPRFFDGVPAGELPPEALVGVLDVLALDALVGGFWLVVLDAATERARNVEKRSARRKNNILEGQVPNPVIKVQRAI
jgi:hypothetical protein